MDPGDRRLTPAPAPGYLVVGRIGRTHGVHGEVRVEVLTDFPELRFVPGRRLYVGVPGDAAPRAVKVASVRAHGAALLVAFDGVPDREAAARLTGHLVHIDVAEAHPLEPDAYYEHQLVGLAVVTDGGEAIGRVSAVLDTGSAPVLEVRTPAGRTVLLPMIAAVIATVDLGAGRITITPLPGLLD